MRPVLLLIPGLSNTSRVWDGLRSHLGDEAEVRVADVLPQADIRSMAEDAWNAVADVPPDVALLVCGFSMGGYVALDMLWQPRRAVQGLALVCTSARADTDEGRALRERACSAIARDFERYIAGVSAHLATPTLQADPILMQAVRDDMRAAGPEAATRQQRAVGARRDHVALLPTLQMPALIVSGALDNLVPQDRAAELAAGLPNAKPITLEGAGHLLPWEKPRELAAQVLAWMATTTPPHVLPS
jgi:pimeloyl-ACP methyl ester carboxylesterase